MRTTVLSGQRIDIVHVQPDPPVSWQKTKTYEIVLRDEHGALGGIRWHPSRRQYALFPRAGTVWEQTYLEEIVIWLARLQ